MAATLQSLFPLTANKGEDFYIVPCYTEFHAPVIGGKYIFNEFTTPAVEFGELLQEQTGIIAGIMLSANCTDEQFTSALEENSPLMLQVLHGENNTPVNTKPFPFTSFAHGDNFSVQWEVSGVTMNQVEGAKLAITGEVNQLTGMTSNELIIRVAFNYIRVGSKKLDPKKNPDFVKFNIFER